MNHRLAMIAAAISLLALSATGVTAQVAPRNYDFGTVTQVTQVEVKPGQLNAYMQDLAGGWRKSMEDGKRAGAILSYGIEQPLDPRPGEANLVLVVVFKNLAAFDRPLADAERSAATQYGSLDKAHEMAMQREARRKILGSEVYRQLAFTQ
ncbi:MAG TPA: hypothetical protein VFC47_06125 [Caulobacteraceae bacterium]|nr:hypothetical protein [Caulobacteraceae bacterium]